MRLKLKYVYSKSFLIISAIMHGIAFWILDSVLDYYYFYEDRFLNLMIVNPPPLEIYIRLSVLFIFIIFGFFAQSLNNKKVILINNLKTSKEKLSKQGLLLESIIESQTDTLIFALDTDYRYIAFNKNHQTEMQKVYNYSIETGDCMLDVIHIPEIQQIAKRSFDRALKGESFIETNIQPDLNTEYEFHWNPIKSSGGDIIGLTALIFDISDQKLSEQKHKESERKLNTLINNLQGIVYKCKNDEHWTMEYLSNGFESLTGYKKEAILNNRDMAFNDIIIDNDKKRVRKEVDVALKENKSFELYYQIKTLSGEIKHVSDKGIGIFSELNGELIALEGFISDITIQKNIERELKIFQTNLEEIVADRTKELEEKNKDLEEFNDLFINREFRIKELRDKIKELEAKL